MTAKGVLKVHENADREFAVAPLTGTRIFDFLPRSLLLTSVGVTKTIWTPGQVLEASCTRTDPFLKSLHETEIAPMSGCTCGVWACKGRNSLRKVFPPTFFMPKATPMTWQGQAKNAEKETFLVSATVEMWGKVIEHEWGYRAQFMRLIPHTLQWFPRHVSLTNRNLLMELREKYEGRML